jgi:hypothetical protein
VRSIWAGSFFREGQGRKKEGGIVGPALTSGKMGRPVRKLLLDVLSDSRGRNDEIAANKLAKYLHRKVKMEEIRDRDIQAMILVKLAQEIITELRLQYQILQTPKGLEMVFKGLDDIDQGEPEASLDQI